MIRGIAAVFLVVVGIGSETAAQPSGRKLSTPVRNACDFAYSLAVRTPGASVRRRIGVFRDETLPQPVFGCGFAAAGSFDRAARTGDVAIRLRHGFTARGWREMPAYSADGPDGTSFAFRKDDLACLVRGSWNSGADDDPRVPADDRYTVTMFCTTPPFPDDRP